MDMDEHLRQVAERKQQEEAKREELEQARREIAEEFDRRLEELRGEIGRREYEVYVGYGLGPDQETVTSRVSDWKFESKRRGDLPTYDNYTIFRGTRLKMERQPINQPVEVEVEVTRPVINLPILRLVRRRKTTTITRERKIGTYIPELEISIPYKMSLDIIHYSCMDGRSYRVIGTERGDIKQRYDALIEWRREAEAGLKT